MNGKQEYEEKLQRKINNVLDENGNYLKSYYNFIGMNKTIQTKYDYLNCVALFMKTCNKNVNDLIMDDFTSYISNIYANMSSSYAIKVYSALKLFGKYLFASRNLSYNPMEYVDRPKYKETKEMLHKREIGVLEKTEIKQYKKNIQTGVGTKKAINRQKRYKSRDMLIAMIFLNTGMRCSALMKIDVSDIDFDNLLLVVSDKGDKLNEYELSNEIIPYINEWIKERNDILNGIECDALFISNQKTRMEQSSIYRVVKKYASNIKGKHITPHKLRATYGTQIYDATKDIYYTQKCMKHNSPTTTELYVRGETNSTKQAACIMSKITL